MVVRVRAVAHEATPNECLWELPCCPYQYIFVLYSHDSSTTSALALEAQWQGRTHSKSDSCLAHLHVPRSCSSGRIYFIIVRKVGQPQCNPLNKLGYLPSILATTEWPHWTVSCCPVVEGLKLRCLTLNLTLKVWAAQTDPLLASPPHITNE